MKCWLCVLAMTTGLVGCAGDAAPAPWRRQNTILQHGVLEQALRNNRECQPIGETTAGSEIPVETPPADAPQPPSGSRFF